MKKILALALLVVAVAGCRSHAEKVADLRAEHPEWSEEDCDRLVVHTTWIGMSEAQLVWVIDREKSLDHSMSLTHGSSYRQADFRIQESPLTRVYSIMGGGGSSYQTWTVDKRSKLVVDWYSDHKN